MLDRTDIKVIGAIGLILSLILLSALVLGLSWRLFIWTAGVGG